MGTRPLALHAHQGRPGLHVLGKSAADSGRFDAQELRAEYEHLLPWRAGILRLQVEALARRTEGDRLVHGFQVAQEGLRLQPDDLHEDLRSARQELLQESRDGQALQDRLDRLQEDTGQAGTPQAEPASGGSARELQCDQLPRSGRLQFVLRDRHVRRRADQHQRKHQGGSGTEGEPVRGE
ncbi:hypothetical protein H0X09_01090 [Candidatus Saccharibacteria bacterium]|nr:hypothetical protein [Candidatus Saccharibacteria bacterium]